MRVIESDDVRSYDFGTTQTPLDARLLLDLSLNDQKWNDMRGAVNLPYGDFDGIGIDLALSWWTERSPGA